MLMRHRTMQSSLLSLGTCGLLLLLLLLTTPASTTTSLADATGDVTVEAPVSSVKDTESEAEAADDAGAKAEVAAAAADSLHPLSLPPLTPLPSSSTTGDIKSLPRVNYASPVCAAKVLAANPKATHLSSLLKEDQDLYMLNECADPDKFIVVELCEAIVVDQIALGNFEFFSSNLRQFRVYVGEKYPGTTWIFAGEFEAANIRGLQEFGIHLHQRIWAKYVRVEFLSNYGKEFFCPLTTLRIHGVTAEEDFHRAIAEEPPITTLTPIPLVLLTGTDILLNTNLLDVIVDPIPAEPLAITSEPSSNPHPSIDATTSMTETSSSASTEPTLTVTDLPSPSVVVDTNKTVGANASLTIDQMLHVANGTVLEDMVSESTNGSILANVDTPSSLSNLSNSTQLDNSTTITNNTSLDPQPAPLAVGVSSITLPLNSSTPLADSSSINTSSTLPSTEVTSSTDAAEPSTSVVPVADTLNISASDTAPPSVVVLSSSSSVMHSVTEPATTVTGADSPSPSVATTTITTATTTTSSTIAIPTTPAVITTTPNTSPSISTIATIATPPSTTSATITPSVTPAITMLTTTTAASAMTSTVEMLMTTTSTAATLPPTTATTIVPSPSSTPPPPPPLSPHHHNQQQQQHQQQQAGVIPPAPSESIYQTLRLRIKALENQTMHFDRLQQNLGELQQHLVHMNQRNLRLESELADLKHQFQNLLNLHFGTVNLPDPDPETMHASTIYDNRMLHIVVLLAALLVFFGGCAFASFTIAWMKFSQWSRHQRHSHTD